MEKTDGDRCTRIGMVSSDPLRVVGLQAILAEAAAYEVIALTAPRALSTEGLEVVLIDSGVTEYLFEMIAAFRRERPALRVMVMGPEADGEYVERVIGAGARGYLAHTVSEKELKVALQEVRDGSVWAPRKILARLLDRPAPARPKAVSEQAPRFTQREKEVLQLLVLGKPNREIAHAMGVDEGTVKAHVGRLMRKMGVANRTALTMQALERHL